MEAKVIEDVGKVIDMYHATFLEMYRVWVNEIVFTWRWWFELIVVTILPWVVWIVVRKKEQTQSLLFAGLFVLVISCFLDMVGVCFALWYYPYKLIPFLPQYISWDFTAMPVTVMLAYQIFPNMKPWIKALLYSGIASFIIQPAAIWLHLYYPMKWKNWYSFPIIFLIYLVGYSIYTKASAKKVKGYE